MLPFVPYQTTRTVDILLLTACGMFLVGNAVSLCVFALRLRVSSFIVPVIYHGCQTCKIFYCCMKEDVFKQLKYFIWYFLCEFAFN
jgi:uncharacterized membrane protein (DUF106 family)